MNKIDPRVTVLLAIIFLPGILVAWDLIPACFFAQLPEWLKTAMAICGLIVWIGMLVGYLFDSGIPQKLFKKRQP